MMLVVLQSCGGWQVTGSADDIADLVHTATIREGILGAVVTESGEVVEYASGLKVTISYCSADYVIAIWDGGKHVAQLRRDIFEPGACDWVDESFGKAVQP